MGLIGSGMSLIVKSAAIGISLVSFIVKGRGTAAALERIFNHLGVQTIYAQTHAGLKLALYYFLGVNGSLRPTP